MIDTLKLETMDDLCAEVARARAKFPKPDGLVLALFEEFAEYCDEKDTVNRRKELLQVACVALRLYEETDPLETHGDVIDLKRACAYFESPARRVIAKLCGEAAAAKSHE
jgi:hypothetical protein